MGDVVKWGGITTIPEDPAATLEKAKSWGLTRVVIAGWNEEGELVFGGSHSETAETNLILDEAKFALLGR